MTLEICPYFSMDSFRTLTHSESAANAFQAFSRAARSSKGMRYVKLGMLWPNAVEEYRIGCTPTRWKILISGPANRSCRARNWRQVGERYTRSSKILDVLRGS